MKGSQYEPDVPAPQMARNITLFALFCYSLIAVTNVASAGARTGRLAVFSLCICLVFAIQVANSSARVGRWPSGARAAALGMQAVLTYAPALWFGLAWGGMLGCLVGSVLLLLRGKAAWIGFAAVSASALALALREHANTLDTVYVVQSTMLTGLVIYGLSRLSHLVSEVYASRGELARTAVLRERLRFARDLHDLLGYSLSSITLRAELIHRLVGINPDRIRAEIAEVLHVSRQALADVRLVASGYRYMSLAAEADSAASTLGAADIRTEVDVDCGRLHPLVDTVLATALREGITNVLRHSKVQMCWISAVEDQEFITLTVVNDGVVAARPQQSPHGGSGLGNLRTRLEGIGGRVDAGLRADGRFQLLARAPLRPEVAEPQPVGSVEAAS